MLLISSGESLKIRENTCKMCAIVGSANKNMFEVLYEANTPRGNFASGVISIFDKGVQILKKQGTINFDQIELGEAKYFIGHLQAPTSAKRDWSFDTSHPFKVGNWIVCHNGVLTNWKEIRAKHPDWDVNPVDTFVIPCLLNYFTQEEECDEEISIKKTLSMLEGTFSVIIINERTKNVYIARQGSALHINNSGNCSSIGGQDYRVVPEGIIMKLDSYEKWKVIDTFETKSPFLFL